MTHMYTNIPFLRTSQIYFKQNFKRYRFLITQYILSECKTNKTLANLLYSNC